MKPWWAAGLLTLGLAPCTAAPIIRRVVTNDGEAAPISMEVELKNYGPAPELKNEIWLNTDQPLRLADLRGKVVLIDMWTFG